MNLSSRILSTMRLLHKQCTGTRSQAAWKANSYRFCGGTLCTVSLRPYVATRLCACSRAPFEDRRQEGAEQRDREESPPQSNAHMESVHTRTRRLRGSPSYPEAPSPSGRRTTGPGSTSGRAVRTLGPRSSLTGHYVFDQPRNHVSHPTQHKQKFKQTKSVKRSLSRTL